MYIDKSTSIIGIDRSHATLSYMYFNIKMKTVYKQLFKKKKSNINTDYAGKFKLTNLVKFTFIQDANLCRCA